MVTGARAVGPRGRAPSAPLRVRRRPPEATGADEAGAQGEAVAVPEFPGFFVNGLRAGRKMLGLAGKRGRLRTGFV